MLIRFVLTIIGFAALALILPRLLTAWQAGSNLYTVENVPSRPVAIIFGAGLWRDGSPSPVLRDRVATAANLYFAGKVEKLLMSGDNRFIDYNEPGAMRSYALEIGVPDEAIILDYAGRSTYDTCYRARDIFMVREAILVTQGFHLPRALFLCRALGISVTGVPADLRQYRLRSLFYWNLRELPATLNALWEAYVTHPLPVLGKPEPIFPDQTKS